MYIQIFCLFKTEKKFFLLLNFISSLYILDIKLYWIYDVQLFSPLVGYLLISLIFPFLCRNFKYDVVSLSLLLLLILVSDLKKINTNTDVKKSTTYVFFYELYGFRPYIQVFAPFLVNFCVWYKVVVQFSKLHLLRRLSFPHCMFLAPLL